jgi:hypothetical protein
LQNLNALLRLRRRLLWLLLLLLLILLHLLLLLLLGLLLLLLSLLLRASQPMTLQSNLRRSSRSSNEIPVHVLVNRDLWSL